MIFWTETWLVKCLSFLDQRQTAWKFCGSNRSRLGGVVWVHWGLPKEYVCFAVTLSLCSILSHVPFHTTSPCTLYRPPPHRPTALLSCEQNAPLFQYITSDTCGVPIAFNQEWHGVRRAETFLFSTGENTLSYRAPDRSLISKQPSRDSQGGSHIQPHCCQSMDFHREGKMEGRAMMN